jgi:hypothetical protein
MTQHKLKRIDVILLLTMVVYVIATFLPWSYDTVTAHISMVAWMMYVLMFFSAICGLIAALRDKGDD